jgi:SAM-dependent methyltransferase
MIRFPDIFKEEFSYSSAQGIWLHGSTESFEYSDGKREESYLEEILASASDLSTASEELKTAIRDWPSRYHLSEERARLLSPFPWPREGRVLEIGAGCGAITRYLGNTFKEVCAVEGSHKRAKLCALRCRGLENVAVGRAHFTRLTPATFFDVIFCIGVLEYAPLYVRDGQPALEVLRWCHRALGEKGTLVLAIENRFGLKYFSGCSEDHSGVFFQNIEGYPGQRPKAVTFGRSEVEGLLREAGFAQRSFFFPFPDYKLPAVILSGNAVEQDAFNLGELAHLRPFTDYSKQRKHLFSDRLALYGIGANNMLADLSNSFLLFATKGKDDLDFLPSWEAVAFSEAGRRPCYQVLTKFFHLASSDKACVVKERLSSESAASEVVEHSVAPKQKMQRGPTVALKLLEHVREMPVDWKAFFALIHRWIQHVTGLPFEQTNGRMLIPGRNLDRTPSNIIVTSAGLVDIDHEWTWRDDLPLRYVVARGIVRFAHENLAALSRLRCDRIETISLLVHHVLSSLWPGELEGWAEEYVEMETRFQNEVNPPSPSPKAAILQCLSLEIQPEPMDEGRLEIHFWTNLRNGTVALIDASTRTPIGSFTFTTPRKLFLLPRHHVTWREDLAAGKYTVEAQILSPRLFRLRRTSISLQILPGQTTHLHLATSKYLHRISLLTAQPGSATT